MQKAVARLINKGLLKIVGAGKTKTLRYIYNTKNNELVTALYGEGILGRLMSATNDLHYTTSSRTYQDKQQRRWRMGEVCAMLDSLGCPLWRGSTLPNRLAAYSSTEIRQSCGDVNLAANSRIAAELVSEAAAYAVYSIGPTLQRWSKAAARQKPDFREGRPRKYTEKQLRYAMTLLSSHSYSQVAEMTGISKSTLVRYRKAS